MKLLRVARSLFLRAACTAFLVVACACSSMAPTPGAAAEPSPPPPAAPEVEVEVEETTGERVDRVRTETTERVQRATQWFDSFFGDEDYEDEIATTRVRLEAGVEVTEGPSFDFEPKLKAQVELPRLEGTATALVIESLSSSGSDEGIGEDDDDIPIVSDPDDEEITGVSAALRWIPLQQDPFNLSFDAGVRLTLPPEPFAKARSRQFFQLAPELSLTTRETLFWILGGDGLGIDAGADFDRRLSTAWLGRLGARAKLATETDGIEWSAGPQLFYRPQERIAVSFRVSAAGRTEPVAIVRNWRVQIRYRQSVLRPWFFYGVEPEVSWPKDEDREFTPALVLRIGVLLDPENTGLKPSDLY